MDFATKEKRSEIMRAVKQCNTKPELEVRRILHRMGYRFRLHVPSLPGKPDIVLPKRRTVVFVHGCFWHRHSDCSKATFPKSRKSFWKKKFCAQCRTRCEGCRGVESIGVEMCAGLAMRISQT